MKWFIFVIAMFIVFSFFLVFKHNANLHKENTYHLKFVVEEAAAASGQYFLIDRFGEGEFVFNQAEGIKALEFILIGQLNLNADLTPGEKTYWQRTDKIIYQYEFIDDSNKSEAYPFTMNYSHPNGEIEFLIEGPSVLLQVNVGKAKYDWLTTDDENYHISLYTWEERIVK